MASLEAIKDAARQIFGIPGNDKQSKGIGYTVPVAPQQQYSYKISVRDDRRSRIVDCSKMVASDGRFARLLYKLAADASAAGFTINVTEAITQSQKDKIQKMIDYSVKTIKIKNALKLWIYNMLKEGDLMLELIVNDSKREITRVKRLATAITMSNMDTEGNFPDDKPAYYQSNVWTNEPIKTFEPWQINHVGWLKEDEQQYGIPMFSPSRVSFQELTKGENNVMIRRALGSGSRKHHKIGDPNKPDDWQSVDEYVKRMEDTQINPLDPVQDYYTTAHVEITELQGDTTIGDMTDIEHFESNAVVISGVPYALLGGGREKSINRDVLEQQQEDYYKVINDITTTMEVCIRRLIDFQLLLYDINPDSVVYTFDWGAKDREDIDMKIKRAQLLQALGYSFETVFEVCNVTGVSYEEELERIKRQVGDGFPYYGIGTKLDANLAMLLSGLLQQQQMTPNESHPELLKISDQLKNIQANIDHPAAPIRNQLIAIKR